MIRFHGFSMATKATFSRIFSPLFPLQVNSVNWNDYANRAFTFVEGPFIIAPLADDDIKEDPNLAFELIIHKEINSSRNAYRCGVTLGGLA